MKFVHAIPKALACALVMMGWGSVQASLNEDKGAEAEMPASIGRMSTTLGGQLYAKVQALRPVAAVPDAKAGESRFDLAVKNAPAAQVFMQLGAGTNYNILVPPELPGTITVSLKGVTVPEALDTLREMFGYDFRITGNRVFIYPNTVQTRLFRINYLPGRRQGASELDISSASSGSSSGSGSGSSGSSGSSSSSSSGSGSSSSGSGTASLTSSVRTTTDTDFWKDVNDSLVALIGSKDGRGVTINAGAGVIVVRATPAELRQVTEYLHAIQVTIERQVMLEAKIVEVQLSKSSESGVNWSLFRGLANSGRQVGVVGVSPGTNLSTSGSISTPNGSVIPGMDTVAASLGKGFYGVAVQSASFSALLAFLETQGNVQVLSSPRIAALNNQKAVLKVGSDDTFVSSVTNNVTVVNNSTVNSPTVTTRTIFSGISLDVTPQIDDSGIVMLHVHPAVSVATAKNLQLTLGDAGTYDVPGVAVSINETDSMVRVRDGNILAIGGLMQQSANRNSNGVPILGNAPVVGSFFRYKTSSDVKRELVILIKPTVISGDGAGSNPTEPDTPLLSSSNDSK
jgi:MSHA biogenesis protein MshL